MGKRIIFHLAYGPILLLLLLFSPSMTLGAKGGTLKWAFQTQGIVDFSPGLGSDGTIYVGSRDNNIYAVNPDGTKKWTFETRGTVDSSPTVGPDGTIYVGSRDNNIYAINPDGTKKWAFETQGAV